MALIMVGRKTGSEAKETFIEKNIKAWSHGIGLESVLSDCEAFIRLIMLLLPEADVRLRDDDPPSWICSSCKRNLAILRSRKVR